MPARWWPSCSAAWVTFRCAPIFRSRCLSNLFYRNKGAYVVGRIINGGQCRHRSHCRCCTTPAASSTIDTVLSTEDDIVMLFSYARAYFMVDMVVPSAYVQFLRSLMPRKPRAEIYSALGLHKQGKNSFYRDLLHHLRYSSDRFRIAPGIKGMVMLVFDLPSFPYVFKLIKDHYPATKKTTRAQVKGKYLLVKRHDRVGRMADTLEYSKVALAAGALRARTGRGNARLLRQPAGIHERRRRRRSWRSSSTMPTSNGG